MFGKVLKKNVGWLLLAAAAVVPMLVVAANSTAIIQNTGVHALNTARIASYVIAALGVAFAGIKLISSAIRIAGDARDKDRTEREIEALKAQKALEERNAKAKLNVKGPLKDAVIYERMKSWLNEDWGRMSTTEIPAFMSDILRQMDDMNGYQAKLSRLLTNNGADYLDDTNGVLESVEQNILRKVRKVLNCFVVYESTRVEDVEKMSSLLKETRDSNEAQLNNVKEFLLAITDFLNRQGDDNTGAEKLDIYKKTILESISDAE
ncbi:MAG: hypothetical protein IKZ82_03820 [Clostridia bacterium]|nr:hypothetical protein [Clostridia bacterium]